METFFDYIGNISNTLGILSFFVSLIIWYKIYHQNKLIKAASKSIPRIENFEQNRVFNNQVNSLNPVAFCLSLIPQSHSI